MPTFSSVRLAATALAAGAVLTAATAAHAEGSLRRFQEPHKSSSSSSSSDSSSSSSSSSSGSILNGILSALFSGGSSSSSSSSAAAADAEPFHPDPYAPLRQERLATTIYGGDREGSYVRPFALDEDGTTMRQVAIPRAGEVRGGGFLSLGDEVVAHDTSVNGFVGLWLLGGGWERFYEPNRTTGSHDTLDMFRLHVGPNVLGSRVAGLELYTLVGAAVMHGFGDSIPAFDLALDARAYPVRPLAFYASTSVSIYQNGPPILDGRLEGGVSLGRVDLRAGFRAIKQQPEQSFLGPVASIVVRL